MPRSLRPPSIPASSDNTLPVIFLTHFNIIDLKHIKRSLAKEDSRWREKPEIDLLPLSYIFWTRSDDGSVKDIYSIANSAYRSTSPQHSGLVFVDRKSLRDSTVVMTLWHQGSLQIRRILASRVRYALGHCMMRSVSIYDIPGPPAKYGRPVWTLHDPCEAPFHRGAPRSQSSPESPALSEGHFKSLQALMPSNPSEPHVISLVPSLDPALQDFVNVNKGVTLHEWPNAHPGTRTDLWRLFHLFPKTTKFEDHSEARQLQQRLFLIYSPLRGAKLSLVLADSAGLRPINLSLLRNTALEPAWSYICHWDDPNVENNSQRNGLLHEIKTVDVEKEVLFNPDMGMFNTIARIWENDDWHSHIAPPVFILFDADEGMLATVMEELETFDDNGIEEGLYEGGDSEEWKHFTIVPWSHFKTSGNGEGNDMDMLRISKATDAIPAVFVDRQTLKDKTVILTDGHYKWERNPDTVNGFPEIMTSYRGIQYGRIPGREAHIDWVNLDVANIDLEEILDNDAANVHTLDLALWEP